MVEDWISQANARQRRGRAGRVKPGICFSLYTRYRFETLMRPFQVLSARKKGSKGAFVLVLFTPILLIKGLF
jgi:hypothetical protein